MTVQNTFADAGIDIPHGASGDVKVHCPQCHEDRKNRADRSLSVNADEGIWNCHHCKWTGSLKNGRKNEPNTVYDYHSDGTSSSGAWSGSYNYSSSYGGAGEVDFSAYGENTSLDTVTIGTANVTGSDIEVEFRGGTVAITDMTLTAGSYGWT